MNAPTLFQQKTIWNAITGIAITVLVVLVVAAFYILGQIFNYLQAVLIPLIIAAIIAFLLDPIVRKLQSKGLSRLWSVLTLFGVIIIAFALLTISIIPAAKSGISMLTPPSVKSSEASNQKLTTQLGKNISTFRRENNNIIVKFALDYVSPEDKKVAVTEEKASWERDPLMAFGQSRLGRLINKYRSELFSTIGSWVFIGSGKVIGVLSFMLGMIMVPVYLFFILNETSAIRRNWEKYLPLRNSEFKTELVETLEEINRYLISFFRGQVLVAVIDGILVGIGLFIFQLPYALLIGVFMAIMGVIPYIGNILCLIPACIIGYLFAQNGAAPFGLGPMSYVIGIVLIFILVQQINSWFTAPKIVGNSVGLNEFTVIFSMLFWSLILGGFIGALLAVPLTAAIKVIFERYIWRSKHS